MKEKLYLKEIFNTDPFEIYTAWLNSELHQKMTGGKATCSNVVGDSFTAWNGYITGKNLALVENQKIVQSWRTTEFDETDDDSLLTIELNKTSKGTEVILIHTNIPEGQTQYEKGWIEHYFVPMKLFFQK